MSCEVGKVTEELENELCYDYNYELRSFSKLPVASPMSQLILQPFRHFTYVTAHSPILPLLHLRHSSFSNPSFASVTSQVFTYVTWRAAHASPPRWGLWNFFRSFKVCSDAKERVGCGKKRETTAPTQSLIKLQPLFLSFR